MNVTAAQLHRDVELGRCSGFPDCCIAHYIFVWSLQIFRGSWSNRSDGTLIHTRPYVNMYRRAMRNVEREVGSIEYVPCPRCLLERRIVKVLKCSPRRCGHPVIS